MKAQVKKLNEDLNEVASNLPIDELNKIYFKQSYDSIKTLWIDNDIEGFERKEKKIMKFLERIEQHKRPSYLLEETKAYNQVCYDLTLKLRSETIQFMAAIHTDAWFANRLDSYLESYTKTGNEEHLKEAIKLIKKIKSGFDILNTPERIQKLEKYVEFIRGNEDLTDEDIGNLNFLNEYTENYHLHNKLKGGGSE